MNQNEAPKTDLPTLPGGKTLLNYWFDTEKREQHLVRRFVQPGMTLFDVGAHIGRYTRLFSLGAGAAGRVFAFEPTPTTSAKLALAISDEHMENVELIQAAVSDKAGTAMLHLFPEEYSSWNGLGFPSMEDPKDPSKVVPLANEVPVRSIRLDEFCRSRAIDRIDYLKLDVEGMEYQALLGLGELLKQQAIGALQFEVSKKMLEGLNTTAAPVFALLASHGYHCHRIGEHGEVGPQVSDSDAFYENFIALPSRAVAGAVFHAQMPPAEEVKSFASHTAFEGARDLAPKLIMHHVVEALRQAIHDFHPEPKILVLETGTIRSHHELHNSTLHISNTLGNRGKLTSVDINPESVQISRQLCQHATNVEWILSDSISYLKSLDYRKYHFVLLDSANDPDVIFNEFALVAPRIVEMGVLMIDDAGVRTDKNGFDESAARKGHKCWQFLSACGAEYDILETPCDHGTQIKVVFTLENRYRILKALDESRLPQSQCGSSKTKELPIHFFTIVLNGRPFIEHHIEVLKHLPFCWHWHIIEGVARQTHDSSWMKQFGGRVTDDLHCNGLSKDGTSEYIDAIAREFPEQVTVYRKPVGEFWDGKIEMVNAPLLNLAGECLLWQVDADEFWTTDQLAAPVSCSGRSRTRLRLSISAISSWARSSSSPRATRMATTPATNGSAPGVSPPAAVGPRTPRLSFAVRPVTGSLQISPRSTRFATPKPKRLV